MITRPTTIQVFAKAPVPGRAKTRLIPALGAEGAARLARRMLDHALGVAVSAGLGPVELWASPGFDSPEWRGFRLPASVTPHPQPEGDLGVRMAHAAAPRLKDGQGRVLLMGADCPAITPTHLVDAASALDCHEAIMLPALDGGYPLLGLSRFHTDVFRDMPWSTPAVADLTLARMQAMQWLVWVGEPLPDIDLPADLIHLPPRFLDSTLDSTLASGMACHALEGATP